MKAPMLASDDPAPAREHAPELTVRAVAIGCAVGAVLATTNVYMGLKTGWNDSGNVTAAILGFALLGVVRSRPTSRNRRRRPPRAWRSPPACARRFRHCR
jgi:uncharacterized oligopeptide transporter (OPT) family protein